MSVDLCMAKALAPVTIFDTGTPDTLTDIIENASLSLLQRALCFIVLSLNGVQL